MTMLDGWWHAALAGGVQYRAPAAALLILVLTWLVGRLLGAPRLLAAAPGLAVALGWVAALGGIALAPRGPVGRLPVLALAALAAGLAGELAVGAGIADLALALASGWWLAGAPLSEAAARRVLPEIAALALGLLLAIRLLRPASVPWAAATAAAALVGALAVLGAGSLWLGLGLVVLVAGLAQAGVPRGQALAALPVAAGIAGLGAVTVLALGRAARGGLNRFDLAAPAALLAAWLLPRLARRLPWAGGLVAAVASAALTVALAWGLARLALR